MSKTNIPLAIFSKILGLAFFVIAIISIPMRIINPSTSEIYIILFYSPVLFYIISLFIVLDLFKLNKFVLVKHWNLLLSSCFSIFLFLIIINGTNGIILKKIQLRGLTIEGLEAQIWGIIYIALTLFVIFSTLYSMKRIKNKRKKQNKPNLKSNPNNSKKIVIAHFFLLGIFLSDYIILLIKGYIKYFEG